MQDKDTIKIQKGLHASKENLRHKTKLQDFVSKQYPEFKQFTLFKEEKQIQKFFKKTDYDKLLKELRPTPTRIDQEIYYKEGSKVRYYLVQGSEIQRFYFHKETSEIMDDFHYRLMRNIQYLDSPNYMVKRGSSMKALGVNSKLNLNSNQNKRNKLLYKFTNYYNTEEFQELIKTGHTLKHLVLTVQHSEIDGWNGIEFYHRQLKEKWNFLRKYKQFKRYIKGGFTSLETTKNENGYHIHLHCFVIQRPDVKDIDVRQYLTYSWSKITGQTNDLLRKYSVHYANLYKTIRSKNGQIMQKIYLNDIKYDKKTFQLDIIQAICELIKYTINVNDDMDSDQLAHYVNDSFRLRVFDKFGSLYKIKELNLNYKDPTSEILDAINDIHFDVQDVKFYKPETKEVVIFKLSKKDYCTLIVDSFKYGKIIINSLFSSTCKDKLLRKYLEKGFEIPNYLQKDPVQHFFDVEMF